MFHQVFVESPDGAYLQKLVNNILSLMPWTLLRQSLKVGNAATMINGVTRLFLTKLSVASFTNWMGWSNNTDDGMNLMQQYALRCSIKSNNMQDNIDHCRMGYCRIPKAFDCYRKVRRCTQRTASQRNQTLSRGSS
jgi:Domain of unknown function in PX-proteins (DUF3818)